MAELDRERREFVESVGMAFERAGRPRMAGRIVAYLLICWPPHQTAKEIRESLGVSVGSVSTQLRHLADLGFVREVPAPDSRARAYEIVPGSVTGAVSETLVRLRALADLMERGRALVMSDDAAAADRIEELEDYYRFFAERLPDLLEEWKAHRAAR